MQEDRGLFVWAEADMAEAQGIDREVFRKRHAEIFGDGPGAPSGTYVMRGGQLVPATLADAERKRKRDATNMVSTATAIHPSQIREFTDRFGHMGVKYRRDGKAVYKDAQAKRKVLAARGMVDLHDLQGGPSR